MAPNDKLLSVSLQKYVRIAVCIAVLYLIITYCVFNSHNSVRSLFPLAHETSGDSSWNYSVFGSSGAVNISTTASLVLVETAVHYNLSENYQSELFNLTLRVENEQRRYLDRVEQLCTAGVVQCSLSGGRNERPQIIQNPPCCDGDLDPFGGRVYGVGVGVVLGDDEIIAGHVFLNKSFVQKVPSFIDIVPCYVYTQCSFSIQAYDTYGKVSTVSGADFRMRLVGDFLLPGYVKDLRNGTYMASYIPQEPGSYLVEVFLGVVQGEGAETGHPISDPYIVDAVIYRSQHLLIVIPSGLNKSYPKTVCTEAASTGRWVHLEGGVCTAPYCVASHTLSDLQLSDSLGLNLDWIWTPWNCYYRLYSPQEFVGCLKSCGITRFSLQGDSLCREQLQNLHMLLTSFSPASNIPKLQLDQWSWSDSINGTNVVLEWVGDDMTSMPTDRCSRVGFGSLLAYTDLHLFIDLERLL